MKKFLLVSLIFLATTSVTAADVKRMTTDQLKSMLNNPDVVILDVRGSWDWVKTDDKITGADRVDPGSASVWAKDYDKGKTIVLYCA